jgi:hypothetical protein
MHPPANVLGEDQQEGNGPQKVQIGRHTSMHCQVQPIAVAQGWQTSGSVRRFRRLCLYAWNDGEVCVELVVGLGEEMVKAPSDVGAFSFGGSMDDKSNYRQLVSNLAALAFDLALESALLERRRMERRESDDSHGRAGGGNSRLLTGCACGGHWPFKNRSILGNTNSVNSTQDI